MSVQDLDVAWLVRFGFGNKTRENFYTFGRLLTQ